MFFFLKKKEKRNHNKHTWELVVSEPFITMRGVCDLSGLRNKQKNKIHLISQKTPYNSIKSRFIYTTLPLTSRLVFLLRKLKSNIEADKKNLHCLATHCWSREYIMAAMPTLSNGVSTIQGSSSGWVQAPPEAICRPLHTCYTENSLWSSTCPTRAGPPATFSPSRPPGWNGGCAPDFPAGCFFGSSGHWSWARPRNLWIKTQWSQALRMQLAATGWPTYPGGVLAWIVFLFCFLSRGIEIAQHCK